ncbi:hypothetical protein GCM10009771_18620 [Nesterenkonia flava]
MDPQDRREWLSAHPDQAALLSDQELSSPADLPSGAEGLYELTQTSHHDPSVQDDIAEAWSSLEAADQEYLLLMFPATFGNLHGVPFDQRQRANEVRVPGELYRVQQRPEEFSDEESCANVMEEPEAARTMLTATFSADVGSPSGKAGRCSMRFRTGGPTTTRGLWRSVAISQPTAVLTPSRA